MVNKFLEKILGAGYIAVEPLLKTGLEGVVVARTAVSWLRNSPVGDLNCGVLLLSKTENGISGCIEFGGGDYLFTDASNEHAAAAIVTSLGVSLDKAIVKDLDIAKLGKTIDLLVKSVNKKRIADKPGIGQVAKPMKPKLPDPVPPQIPQIKTKGRISSIPSIRQQQKPDPRAMVPPTLPIKPGIPNIKLSEKEMVRKCEVCGLCQCNKNQFVGCSCFKGLSKSVKSQLIPGGLQLSFDGNWDLDAVETLLEAVGRNG